jgi:uncharacterized coiled-coil protein SlyX
MAQDPAIAAFVSKMNDYVTAIGADIDDMVTKIATLNDTITTLQNSAGKVDAADQALIDQLQSQGAALAAKADSADGKTPPPPPPV